MNRLIMVSLLSWLILFFGACRARNQQYLQYYVIEYPVELRSLLPDTLPVPRFSIGIAPVKVYPTYASHRIAIRQNTHELRYFVNHQWAVRPSEALTRFVFDFFEQRQMFTGLFMQSPGLEADLLLLVNVYQLEVVLVNRKYYARLNLSFRLTKAKTEHLVADHQSDIVIELPKRNLNLFASEISRAFYSELDTFASDVVDFLSK